MKGLSPDQAQALVDWLASLRDECTEKAEKDREADRDAFAEYRTGRAHSLDFVLLEIDHIRTTVKEVAP